MADKIIQMTDNGGDNVYPKQNLRQYSVWFSPGYSNAARYCGFARIANNSSGTAAGGVMLLAGIQTVGSTNKGVAIVQYRAGNNALTMSATLLAPMASTAAEFGFWDGGDGYWYMGVRQQAQGSAISITLLVDYHSTTYKTEITTGAEFYDSATAPTGWTAVSYTS